MLELMLFWKWVEKLLRDLGEINLFSKIIILLLIIIIITLLLKVVQIIFKLKFSQNQLIINKK